MKFTVHFQGVLRVVAAASCRSPFLLHLAAAGGRKAFAAGSHMHGLPQDATATYFKSKHLDEA